MDKFWKVIGWLFAISITTIIGLIIFLCVTLEGYQGGVSIEETHRRAVKTFVDEEGFGFNRVAKRGYWNIASMEVDGESYGFNRPEVTLIGLTPEYGPRIYEADYLKKSKLGEYRPHPLNEKESQAIQKLRDGSPYARIDEPESDTIRIIAPILAQENCLTCHDGKVRDFLGAFDYRLYAQDLCKKILEAEDSEYLEQ